jgi:hypothetical protein
VIEAASTLDHATEDDLEGSDGNAHPHGLVSEVQLVAMLSHLLSFQLCWGQRVFGLVVFLVFL